MKKSLIALAVLASAGAASAQSSVTLFGVVDAAVQHLRADGNGSVTRLGSGANASSRIGFRGTEDLGGGMNASFWLEAGMSNDDGQGQATNVNNALLPNLTAPGAVVPQGTATGVRAGQQGLTFNRRSTLSLGGGWGEVRLGRDYTPSFLVLTTFDPFGTVGSGSILNMSGSALTTATGVRASNSIQYFLPSNIGGVYGNVMYALGENARNVPGAGAAAAAAEDDGNLLGARVGFASGPFNVAVGLGRTRYAAGDLRAANIGGSWNFGFARLLAQVARDETLAAAGGGRTRFTTAMIGGLVPLGAGELKASFARTNIAGTGNDGNQIALGYVHNLSKRTALYTTYSRVDNKGSGIRFNNGRPLTAAGAGGDTQGLDLGVRHSF